MKLKKQIWIAIHLSGPNLSFSNSKLPVKPVESVHPLIHRHPVTGEKALFVNKQFSRQMVGLKIEESNVILDVLYNHIAQGHDFPMWKPRTVVLWDNEWLLSYGSADEEDRVTVHSATGDYDPETMVCDTER